MICIEYIALTLIIIWVLLVVVAVVAFRFFYSEVFEREHYKKRKDLRKFIEAYGLGIPDSIIKIEDGGLLTKEGPAIIAYWRLPMGKLVYYIHNNTYFIPERNKREGLCSFVSGTFDELNDKFIKEALKKEEDKLSIYAYGLAVKGASDFSWKKKGNALVLKYKKVKGELQ